MTILTHATRNVYVPLILKEGLKLPSETGNCNWPEYSASDRISFYFILKKHLFQKQVLVLMIFGMEKELDSLSILIT